MFEAKNKYKEIDCVSSIKNCICGSGFWVVSFISYLAKM